jgi:hypothetical protein
MVVISRKSVPDDDCGMAQALKTAAAVSVPETE